MSCVFVCVRRFVSVGFVRIMYQFAGIISNSPSVCACHSHTHTSARTRARVNLSREWTVHNTHIPKPTCDAREEDHFVQFALCVFRFVHYLLATLTYNLYVLRCASYTLFIIRMATAATTIWIQYTRIIIIIKTTILWYVVCVQHPNRYSQYTQTGKHTQHTHT